MTVNTSNAGYNYNSGGTAITGSYNDAVNPYIGPYRLKYGEQLNFLCSSTSQFGIFSDNITNFTFTTDLRESQYIPNNFRGSTYHRFDQGNTYYTNDNVPATKSPLSDSQFALICVNINGNNNLYAGNDKKSVFIFRTPKRYTISYRN